MALSLIQLVAKANLLYALAKKEVMITRVPIIKTSTSIFERWYLFSRNDIDIFYTTNVWSIYGELLYLKIILLQYFTLILS